jgi:hypothetical protein
MSFDVEITLAGLGLLILNDAPRPEHAELVFVDTKSVPETAHKRESPETNHAHTKPITDTSSETAHEYHSPKHHHEPYLNLPLASLGNVKDSTGTTLPGWGTYSLGADGLAYSHLSLVGKILRLVPTWATEAHPAKFSRSTSMKHIPNLRDLGVKMVYHPKTDDSPCLPNATTRVSLPAGKLSASDVVRDRRGPICWKNVGNIAERVRLELKCVEKLEITYHSNSFLLHPPKKGKLKLSITQEPMSYDPKDGYCPDDKITAPHFHLLGRLADCEPHLEREPAPGKKEYKDDEEYSVLTPQCPLCPCGIWIDGAWPFLDSGKS